MRPASISYDDVAEACGRLTAKERKVSVRAVHAELDNRGSMSTLTPLVRRWFVDEEDRRATDVLDSDVAKGIVAWVRRTVATETVAQSNELRELREQCQTVPCRARRRA
jgi:hypothetical protein